MSLIETTLTTPGPDQVIFYEGLNFQGKAYLSTLGSNVDIYKDYRPLNDKLNSVKVGAACKVIAFYAANFGLPSKELNADTANINVDGMSAFIVLNRAGTHALLFSFADSTGQARRMSLQSAGLGLVTQPNPEPEPGTDPNIPRAFATLKESDGENTPLVTAIFIRKTNSEYESPLGSIQFYWKDGKPHAKNIPEYETASLTYTQADNVFKFTWK